MLVIFPQRQRRRQRWFAMVTASAAAVSIDASKRPSAKCLLSTGNASRLMVGHVTVPCDPAGDEDYMSASKFPADVARVSSSRDPLRGRRPVTDLVKRCHRQLAAIGPT